MFEIFLILLICLSVCYIIFLTRQLRSEKEKLAVISRRAMRNEKLFLCMMEWVKAKIDGKNVSLYFEKRGWLRIAVYGIGVSGLDRRLYEELEGSPVKIIYGIDRAPDSVSADVDVYSPDDKLESVDAVVVTAVAFYDEIKKSFSGKMNSPIISLMDVFQDMKIPLEEAEIHESNLQ